MSISSRSPIRESAPGITVGWGGWGAASAVGDGSFRLPPLKHETFFYNTISDHLQLLLFPKCLQEIIFC